MILSADEIARRQKNGSLTITPFETSSLRPASYVLTLGSRFRTWKRLKEPIELWSREATKNHLGPVIESETIFVLEPGQFVLAETRETMVLAPDLLGTIAPLSHVTRFGLGLNGGSSFIGPGFGSKVSSPLTLELYNYNPSPLVLKVGMPLMHLRLHPFVPSASGFPPSIYEGKDPLTNPLLYEEWNEK